MIASSNYYVHYRLEEANAKFGKLLRQCSQQKFAFHVTTRDPIPAKNCVICSRMGFIFSLASLNVKMLPFIWMPDSFSCMCKDR